MATALHVDDSAAAPKVVHGQCVSSCMVRARTEKQKGGSHQCYTRTIWTSLHNLDREVFEAGVEADGEQSCGHK